MGHEHDPGGRPVKEPLDHASPLKSRVVRGLVEQQEVVLLASPLTAHASRPRRLNCVGVPVSWAGYPTDPERVIVPASGSSDPREHTRRSVVFPIPFGPTMPTRSPGETTSETRVE